MRLRNRSEPRMARAAKDWVLGGPAPATSRRSGRRGMRLAPADSKDPSRTGRDREAVHTKAAEVVAQILVVDDEPLFRSSVADAISDTCKGYRVLEACDGREALDLVAENAVDVVVTDIQMPIMDGVELIVALQKTRFRGPIIVVTAFGSAHLKREVASHGAIAYLEKPIDLPELIEVVRNSASGERSHIEGFTLAGITQLLELERKSCVLRVTKGRESGDLIFQDGALIDAHLGELSGNEAALALLAWDEGEGLDLLAGVGLPTNTVTEGLTHLLLEAMRLRDEKRNEATRGGDHVPAPTHEKENAMGNVAASLEEAMQMDGAIGVALVDHESGMSLGQAGGGSRLNLDVAGAGNTAVVRAKMRVMKDLGLDEGIEDILITLGGQYHLIRPLADAPNLFLYLALDRGKANLAMARHRLTTIEKGLVV